MISNRSGTDDDYYFLIFDEDSANLFVEHSWHYLKSSHTEEGSEKITLSDLKTLEPGVYRRAVAVITAAFPSESEDSLTYPFGATD
jgi:hypothetical protein